MDKTYRTVGRAFNLAHKTITKRIQDNFEEYDIPQDVQDDILQDIDLTLEQIRLTSQTYMLKARNFKNCFKTE